LIKTLQTHFINVSKLYLHCGTQRQSSGGALMDNTMFSRKLWVNFIIGIHYQKGAKAKNAQIREKDSAAKGNGGGYGEEAGEGRVDE